MAAVRGGADCARAPAKIRVRPTRPLGKCGRRGSRGRECGIAPGSCVISRTDAYLVLAATRSTFPATASSIASASSAFAVTPAPSSHPPDSELPQPTRPAWLPRKTLLTCGTPTQKQKSGRRGDRCYFEQECDQQHIRCGCRWQRGNDRD